MRRFSKLEHIFHYKAKNQNTVNTNLHKLVRTCTCMHARMCVHAHERARTHTHTGMHARTHTHTQSH